MWVMECGSGMTLVQEVTYATTTLPSFSVLRRAAFTLAAMSMHSITAVQYLNSFIV